MDGANEQTRTAAMTEPSSPVNAKPSSRHRSKRSSRALSDATGFSPSDHVVSHDHPALSMPEFLDTFGPLVFPIYRAALLRKRILLLGTPPVQRSCDFGNNFQECHHLVHHTNQCDQSTTFPSLPTCLLRSSSSSQQKTLCSASARYSVWASTTSQTC